MGALGGDEGWFFREGLCVGSFKVSSERFLGAFVGGFWSHIFRKSSWFVGGRVVQRGRFVKVKG